MTASHLRQFDYKEVAALETEMWRSYYNHRFLKLFRQLFRVLHSQIGLSWWHTLGLAWYTGLAATRYRLMRGHENYPAVESNLVNFFKIISDHGGESFDYKKAGELELKWWDIHRYPDKYKGKSLVEAIAEAQAVVYKVNPSGLEDYARYRMEAALLPNHQGDKQDKPPDWQKINRLLVKSWGALHQAVQK